MEIGWLNAFRVRAAAEALLGYDLSMENFDQSPFHRNETGSQNVRSLAVAGERVPAVEGHSDARARWTANLATFSDTARIKEEGPPYVELMFKYEPEGPVQRRLDEHIRSRGYGGRVSAACSNSGSYKTADVLQYLRRHLPDMTDAEGGGKGGGGGKGEGKERQGGNKSVRVGQAGGN